MSRNTAASERVPKAMQAIYNEVIGLTDPFCGKHLNGEYIELCRRMTAMLARKESARLDVRSERKKLTPAARPLS